jgi:hypothetical protein
MALRAHIDIRHDCAIAGEPNSGVIFNVSDEIYRRRAELLEADINDELVGLEPQQGNCFGFNAVATSVWRDLENPKSFDQLRDKLLDEYDVSADQCARELRELLDDLVAKGLIEKG